MKFIFAFLLTISTCAQAFDKQEIIYKPDGKSGAAVKFSFDGAILKPSLSVVKGVENLPENSLKPIMLFLNKVYKANYDGSKDAILAVWDVSDKNAISASMDKKSLDENKARFTSMSDMRLKMLIEYGDKYICFVEVHYEGGKPFIMKFPLLSRGENLYLTNSLNGDYFYDNISHFLDGSNFIK